MATIEQAQKIKTGFQTFTLTDFVNNVSSKVLDGGWEEMNQSSVSYVYNVPSISFMNGPLNIPLTSKKARKQIVRDKIGALEKPTEIVDTEADVNSGASQRVKTLLNELNKYESISFWEFVFDPHSYGRTVENIFHFAFLIRNGYASITNRDGDAFASPSTPPTEDQIKDENIENTQCILRFEYKMWQKLRGKYQKAILPPPPEDPYRERK